MKCTVFFFFSFLFLMNMYGQNKINTFHIQDSLIEDYSGRGSDGYAGYAGLKLGLNNYSSTLDGNEWTVGFLYAFETCLRKVVETEYLTPTSGIGIAFGREQIVNKLTKDKIIGYKVTIDGFRSFTDNGGEGAPLVTPMLRLSVARYAGLSQHELQLQPQVGLRVFGLFAVHYGYTVHLSGTAFEKMPKRSLSINAFIPVRVFAE